MKTKSLFCGLLMGLAVVACDPDDVVVTPALDVDKDAVSVGAEAGEASFNVTSNVDWTASADADWVVSVTPSSGKASEEAVVVTVAVEENVAYEERTATVTVTAGELKKTVTVTQAAAVEPASLDGYQWLAEVDGMQVLFDFGLTEEGMLTIALPTMDESGFGLYMAGLYEAVATDGASGVINYTPYDWEWDELLEEYELATYSELTATSVKLACESVFGVTDPISFSRVETPYEIIVDNGGGDDPVGSIENGNYWFVNGGKVMAPLAEGETSGKLPAVDAVDGVGTAENVFTLTYDPDMSGYTIQDVYGRYLGNPDYGEEITLASELPAGEDYVYYLWVVDIAFVEQDGTCDVYGMETYNGFAYSADSNFWFASATSWETDGVRPTLVKAE